LVLSLTGWLRFGGGMANVAASLDPALPFPFPTLEAELPDGTWARLPTSVGAPAGKTKTILVELGNELPVGCRRLRLTTAFEIYWDAAELCAREPDTQTLRTTLAPDRAELGWRGFSELEPASETSPLTPIYEAARPSPPWRKTPSGWCTRYGSVNPLLAEADDAFVLLNGGDELALSFRADHLPPKPPGYDREFFLHVTGWDKDADFHVGKGWSVEPLPFHGMDDQAYTRQAGPMGRAAEMMRNYNTRWVGPFVPPLAKSKGAGSTSRRN
jgi:hypothetical protein